MRHPIAKMRQSTCVVLSTKSERMVYVCVCMLCAWIEKCIQFAEIIILIRVLQSEEHAFVAHECRARWILQVSVCFDCNIDRVIATARATKWTPHLDFVESYWNEYWVYVNACILNVSVDWMKATAKHLLSMILVWELVMIPAMENEMKVNGYHTTPINLE